MARSSFPPREPGFASSPAKLADPPCLLGSPLGKRHTSVLGQRHTRVLDGLQRRSGVSHCSPDSGTKGSSLLTSLLSWHRCFSQLCWPGRGSASLLPALARAGINSQRSLCPAVAFPLPLAAGQRLCQPHDRHFLQAAFRARIGRVQGSRGLHPCLCSLLHSHQYTMVGGELEP